MGNSQTVIQPVNYSEPIDEKTEGQSQIRRNPISKVYGLLDKINDQSDTLNGVWLNNLNKFSQHACVGQRDANGKYQTKTYQEFHDISREIASGVINLNLADTNQEYLDFNLTMVGIYAKNREEWLMVDVGCGHLYGMTIIPFYDTLGPENISYCLKNSNVSVIFASSASFDTLLKTTELANLKYVVALDQITEQQKENAKNSPLKIISIDEVRSEGRKNIREYDAVQKVTPNSVLTFSYTSGTTGNPKAAMLSHRNFTSIQAVIYNNTDLRFTKEDVHLSYLPLPHVMDRAVCIAMLSQGASIYFYSGDPLKLKQDIADVRPTIFVSVPRLFNKFYDAIMGGINGAKGLKKFLANYAIDSKLHYFKNENSLSHKLWDKLVFKKIREDVFGGRVRLMVTGSAPLSKDVLDFFQIALSCPMIEAYGQTESSAASFSTSSHDNISGHVGGPTTNIEFKVDDIPEMNYMSTDKDKDGNPQPRGEICFRGPGVFVGYYKDLEKTKEAIDSDGWLHSGDVGMINKNGSVNIIDRKKNIFKLSQGEYVAPEKIEACYLKSQGVAEVFVHGDSLESHLVGIVVPDQTFIEQLGVQYGISGTFQELCQNEQIRKHVNQSMYQQGKKDKLFGFEQIKNLRLEPVSFAIHKCLTNTMKLQRHQAKIIFQEEIKELYKQPLLI